MFKNNYRKILKLSESDTRELYYKQSSPDKIWEDVLQNDKDQVSDLCEAMKKLLYAGKPNWMVRALAGLLYEHVYKDRGRYMQDCDFWADQCSSMSRPLMSLIQRQYTLAHLGCSVVSFWDEKAAEMVCVRSLDWNGADALAPCTRKFVFCDNDKKRQNIQVAGVAGMVGILTGMKEQFSLCINYAPWSHSARFHTEPTFLIRDLLSDDTVISYEDACSGVQNWLPGAPCFISLCGRQKGEACVVAFGADGKQKTRKIGDANYIVQTNHFEEDSEFAKHNEKFYKSDQYEEDQWYWSKLLRNSKKRREMIEAIMDGSLTDVENATDHILGQFCNPPLINFETAQWVVMRPKSMHMDIYASTSLASCPADPFKVEGIGD